MMCIKQVTSFAYNGQLYESELLAVRAALQDIGTRLFKEYSNNPLDGLLELGGDVSKLRDRYKELTTRADEPEMVMAA